MRYQGGKKRIAGQISTDAFWDTMRDWSRDNVVVVSELSAPKRSLGRIKKGETTGKKAVEKLFIHESWVR